MNKLLQTTLISAIFTTSGFAAEISNTIAEGTKLDVQGEAVANNPTSVAGELNVQGGSLQNNKIMTYNENGSLIIADRRFEEVIVGSFKIKIENIKNGNIYLADLSSIFKKDYWEFCSESGTKIPHNDTGRWSDNRTQSVTEGYFTITQNLQKDALNTLLIELNSYESSKSLSGCNFGIKFLNSSDSDINLDDIATSKTETGTFKQSSTVTSTDTTLFAACFPTEGVLDVSAITSTATGTFLGGPIQGGTIKLKHGTTKFTNLSVSSAEKPIVGVYEYDVSAATKLTTVIKSSYIKPEDTAGTTDAPEEQFKAEFKNGDSISLNTDLAGYNDNGTAISGLYLYADPDTKASDGRKTFPEVLADSTLNATTNKLSTADVVVETGTTDPNYGTSAIKDVKKVSDTSALSVATEADQSPEIKISFEGNKDLILGAYNVDDNSSLVVTNLTFSGTNSYYSGTFGVDGNVAQVTANGDLTLPQKLAEDFSSTELVIASGENAIDNEREAPTTIKSLQLNSGSLTIAPGTSIVLGNNS